MTVLLSKSEQNAGDGQLVLTPVRNDPVSGPDQFIPGFESLGLIGHGAMATVYKARHMASQRVVALKTVRADVVDEDAAPGHAIDRLLSEAGLLTGLKHPHLMPFYGLGYTGEWFYVSMLYATGGDMIARITAGITVTEALAVTADVARGLDFAHARGLVHRDVKPANILFRDNGDALLSDFGLAKPFRLQIGLTSAGLIMGSPAYMSPEQGLGHKVTGQSDIYALGATLFQALTTHTPYQCRSVLRLIKMHIEAPVPTLPPHLSVLQEIIERSMAKDPGDRFRTALEMAGALDKAAATMQVDAPALVNSVSESVDAKNGHHAPTCCGSGAAVSGHLGDRSS